MLGCRMHAQRPALPGRGIEGVSPVPTARAGTRIIQRLPDARPGASAFRSLSRGVPE